MAGKLDRLRGELHRLRNARRLIRQATGAGLLLMAAVGILLSAFLADWRLDMSRAQRVVLLGLVAAALVWAFRRLTRPWLEQHEDLVDLALLVEQRQRIDSDLVSALQFEQPAAREWGSEQLEQAVVTQVAARYDGIDVFEGLKPREFPRRMATFAGVAGLAVVACLVFRGHSAAFFQRMLLADVQYPTRTRIQVVEVNGLDVQEALAARRSIPSPVSHPVRFTVTAGGELPLSGAGVVRVETLDGSVATDVVLQRQEKPAGQGDAGDAGSAARFAGELPRLMGSVSFRVLLGDARTPAVTIEAIPLPVVELHVKVTPPDYAAGMEESGQNDAARTQRQLAVLEGSRVDLRIESLNKPLEKVRLWLDDDEYRMVPVDDQHRAWTINPEGTPLASVTRSLRYRVEVTDQQKLPLESPIHGSIRLKTDQAPRVTATVRTRRVVPTAMPPVTWSASDDYGLFRVSAQVQVARASGETDEVELDVVAPAVAGSVPVTLGGTWPLDLSGLKLTKGDALKLTLIAYDFRGDGEPRRSFSEPIQIQVTDRQGILAGLLETDEESAKQLDAIIRRELGIGETK